MTPPTATETPTIVPQEERPTRLSRVPAGVSLAALALGGLAIGTTEFASMGVLPGFASDLGVSVPTAGIAISAYALGVVVGAPLITLIGARWPRKQMVVVLAVAFVAGQRPVGDRAVLPAVRGPALPLRAAARRLLRRRRRPRVLARAPGEARPGPARPSCSA